MKRVGCLAFVAAWLFTCCTASAQVMVAAYGSIANLRDLGYRGSIGPEDAAWLVGASLEYQTERFRFGLAGDYTPAAKDSAGKTWSVAGTLSGAYRPTTWSFFGASYGASHTNTDLWAKTAQRVSVFAGFDFPFPYNFGDVRVRAGYTFKSAADENHLRGERIDVTHVVGAWESPWHPVAAVSYGRWRFDSGGLDYRGRTWQMNIGLAYRK